MTHYSRTEALIRSYENNARLERFTVTQVPRIQKPLHKARAETWEEAARIAEAHLNRQTRP